MTRLIEVWDQVWRAAGADSRDSPLRMVMTKEKNGMLVPSDRVSKAIFPTALRDVPNEHRRPAGVISERRITDAESALIRESASTIVPTLLIACTLYSRLKLMTRGHDLGVSDRQEWLLRVAYDLAASTVGDTSLDDATLNTEIAKAVGATSTDVHATSTTDIHNLLDSDEVTSKLENELAATADSTKDLPADQERWESLDTALCAFLDADNRAARRGDAAAATALEDAWRTAIRSPAELWHLKARHIGLTRHQAPPPPPVREPRPRRQRAEIDVAMAWLDASLERRITSALRLKAAERASLPRAEELVREEIVRSRAPLGLSSREARTAFAAGAAAILQSATGRYDDVGQVLGTGTGTTRASKWIGGHLRTAQKAAESDAARATDGQATWPHLVMNHLEDPVAPYLAMLWVRLHGYEVRRVDITGQIAWELITKVTIKTGKHIRAVATRLAKAAARDLDLERRVASTLAHLKAIGISEDEYRDFIQAAEADDKKSRAWWATWTSNLPERVTLAELLRWRKQHGNE